MSTKPLFYSFYLLLDQVLNNNKEGDFKGNPFFDQQLDPSFTFTFQKHNLRKIRGTGG